MLALSPPMFSGIEWPLFDESTSHNNYNYNQNCIYKATTTPDLQMISSPRVVQVEEEVQRCTQSAPTSPSPDANISNDPSMAKKLHHNASERHRRTKISTLYSSLRSMLPLADQTKKLSIPATISRVLKYIPELQQQVEGLVRKKGELLLRISRKGEEAPSKECPRKFGYHHSACVVSTSSLKDSEAVIQICSDEVNKTPLSEILLCLEKQGLLLLNASSFETFGGKVFYNLHLQVEKNCRLESDILREKLLSMYEKKEGVFNFNVSKYDD